MFGSRRRVAEPEEILQLKKKQIESLKSHNDMVKEIQNETVYEVPTKYNGVTISIVLVNGFPVKAPTLYVSPPMRHPSVNEEMMVTHPKLKDWSVHSSLGKVVKDISKEFKHTPPTILPAQENTVIQPPADQYIFIPETIAPDVIYPQPSQSSPIYQRSIFPPPPVVAPKPFETVPELEQLSNRDLEQLLDDDLKFEEFLKSIEKVKNTEVIVGELQQERERVALRTLEKESVLKELQKRLAEQKQALYRAEEECKGSSQLLNSVMMKYSPQSITHLLKVEIEKGEAKSDEIAERFFAKEIDVSQFIKLFIEEKKMHHKRSAKLEMISNDPSILSRS